MHEIWRAKKAVIHRRNCGHCNGGRRHENGCGVLNWGWHGPFPTCDAAGEFATKLPIRAVRVCGHCKPR